MMLLEIFAVAAWLTAAVAAAQEDTVQVRLQQGVIEGVRAEAEGGRFFYAFKSIPFAKPPVGELRFKNPVPAEAWPGVRNGTQVAPKCPQMSLAFLFSGVVATEGSEDCLYLTVYTPKPSESDLPVMVWIHGGAFVLGDSEEYQALPLLTKDVVLVVVQYRLGTLGFLSTGDSALPGNLGLKDQVMALRWVQDNIRNFGGDPDKVTIFGESAGGASVHFHILSPMSTGLFQRAIMQSGTSLCPWALREDHKQVAMNMSEIFNCSAVDSAASSLDSTALVACLRDVPFASLVEVQSKFIVFNDGPQVMMPGVDGEFLPDHPAVLLREGRYNKVDIISGMTEHEGGMAAYAFLASRPLLDSLLQNFSVNGPVALGFEAWEGDTEYLSRRAFHRYMGPLEVPQERADDFTQLHTDRLFAMCHLDAVKHHLLDRPSGSRVYAYELQHRGQYGLFDDIVPPSNISQHWVVHSDDLQYLFDKVINDKTLTRSEDLFVSRIMVDLWTNFAATGNPTPDLSLGFKWAPMSSAKESYLAITLSPSMADFENQKVQEFWRNIPTKTNKLLYPDRFLPTP
ncbi:cocaine esterase-like isoform X2 [Penaeus japonicus]|uniref:cocaine esterase-like isoform X2 n=1 Tax=Penaeus japonicus TaxID=27405 RepID=UPI001C714306|nr:cocaine esterase-like isoform X2 [Penaeus japonicus]